MKQRLYSYFYNASLSGVIINLIAPMVWGMVALNASIAGGSVLLAIISILLIVLAVVIARTRYMLSKLYKNSSKWEVIAQNSVICKFINEKFGVDFK